MATTISPAPSAAARIQAVRGFNRFYTQRIGVLDPYLGSELSLTEVRVLYELAHRDQPTASELGRDLALDAGYLSRILRRFESKGWLARVPSIADARQSLLALTKAGHLAFAPLQQQSSDEAAALLAALGAGEQQKLVNAMGTVQRLLASTTAPAPTRTIVLRDPKPGDMGWVVQQHGEIYAREYGWNSEFEALVAGIVSKYLKNFQPDSEKCWIAELDGERVG
ncbi:MAG: MarR family winged helix-turn-helix transcriptional regulator, partial [Burkholderiales bacterium]